MIKAEHNSAARLLFNIYSDRLLRKNFSAFYLVNKAPEISKSAPLIITPNHFSWWDGFLIDFVNRKIFKRKLHIMMLEGQLKKYWFFRYLGAYSIRQENPKSIIETGSYAREISTEAGNLNIIYPQGEIEPYDRRPVSIKSGLKYFIKGLEGSSAILPVFFRIQFEDEMKPAVYCCFGEIFSLSETVHNYDSYKLLFEAGLCQLDKAAKEKKISADLFRAEEC